MGASYASKARGVLTEQALDQDMVAGCLGMVQSTLSRKLQGDSGILIPEAARLAVLLARYDMMPAPEAAGIVVDDELRVLFTKAIERWAQLLTPDELREMAQGIGLMLYGVGAKNKESQKKVYQGARIMQNLAEAPDPRLAVVHPGLED